MIKSLFLQNISATQMYLQWFLKQHGITSVPFRGGFKRGKKDWMRELFKSNAQVLIATEAGGEGINLQFCSHIINYDLPWNPMRLGTKDWANSSSWTRKRCKNL